MTAPLYRASCVGRGGHIVADSPPMSYEDAQAFRAARAETGWYVDEVPGYAERNRHLIPVIGVDDPLPEEVYSGDVSSPHFEVPHRASCTLLTGTWEEVLEDFPEMRTEGEEWDPAVRARLVELKGRMNYRALRLPDGHRLREALGWVLCRPHGPSEKELAVISGLEYGCRHG